MMSSRSQFSLTPPESDRAGQNPVAVFREWFEEAKRTEMKEPSAVFLATATRCGAPSCRVVLLKSFDDAGFVIYTNTTSRKGKELQENPQAALCFYWPELKRQVRIEGYVNTVSDAEADAYFASRPLNSRIGAWASRQSAPMKNRSELLKRVAYYTAKWATGTVDRPPHWTGFRIVPDYFEFWQNSSVPIPERQVFYQRDDLWYAALLQP